jgi:hypothetical protein
VIDDGCGQSIERDYRRQGFGDNQLILGTRSRI